jgi:Fe-S cluster assembly protein SufD
VAVSVSDLRDKFRNPGSAELELIARYAMLPENGQRERAFEAFALTGLPHRRMEAWKWTDFKAALKSVESSKNASQSEALPSGDHAETKRNH